MLVKPSARINFRLLLFLTIGFIFVTAVGTFTHESAHFVVAKYVNFKPHLSYNKTWWHTDVPNNDLLSRYDFYITLSGTLQTIGAGTIGFILLLLLKKYFTNKVVLVFWQWVLIFIALFWARQIFNFLVLCINYAIQNTMVTNSDEVKIAQYFHLPSISIIGITASIGFIVCWLVIDIFIPKVLQTTFLLSAFLGCTLGYIIWFKLLGPSILP